MQLFDGGDMRADSTDPTCSNTGVNYNAGATQFSIFDSVDTTLNTAVFTPGAAGYSGTVGFKVNALLSEPSLQLTSFNGKTKVYGVSLVVPSC